MIWNLLLTYTLNNEPETKCDELRTFNKKSQDLSALGFKFDTSNITTQIVAINNVLEEFKAALYAIFHFVMNFYFVKLLCIFIL